MGIIFYIKFFVKIFKNQDSSKFTVARQKETEQRRIRYIFFDELNTLMYRLLRFNSLIKIFNIKKIWYIFIIYQWILSHLSNKNT